MLVRYDSLTNYPANPQILIGQNLIVPDIAENIRENGYKGFYSDIEKMETYAPCKKNPRCSQYEMLKKKYLNILEVVDKNNKNFLKLKNSNNDTVFFEYPERKDDWIFTVEGYYEKLDSKLSNTLYISRKDIEVEDFKYGKPLVIRRGEQLQVKSLFVRRPNDMTYGTICVVLMLPDKNHILVPFNCIDINTQECEVNDFERSIVWLGHFDNPNVKKEHLTYIFNEKVVEGMHPIECELSWGVPYQITPLLNETDYKEWWLYDKHKVQFINGLVSKIEPN